MCKFTLTELLKEVVHVLSLQHCLALYLNIDAGYSSTSY